MVRKIRAIISKSIFSRHLSAAIFWGTVVCALINIVELEYNIAALFAPSLPAGGSGQIIGGFVAGYLEDGTRRDTLKAGGYAGALPIIVFGPVALVLRIGTPSTAFPLESTLLQYLFGFLIVYPFMIGMGFLFGCIGGLAGHWISRNCS